MFNTSKLLFAGVLSLLTAGGSFALATSPVRAAPVKAQGKFPETLALQAELTALENKLTAMANRMKRGNAQIDAARKQVKAAADLVDLVGYADDGLGRVIRELKTLSAIPALKMLPSIIKMLEKAKKQLHAVRLKGDKFDKDVLKPLEAALTKMRNRIQLAINSTTTAAANTRKTRDGLSVAMSLLTSLDASSREIAALEQTSKTARAGIKPVAHEIARLEQASADIEKLANTVAASLQALTKLRPGVAAFNKSIKPFSDAAGELKKVMSQRVSVTIFGKHIGFTVRQVLEGPKGVADIVLKPLQSLANAAVSAVMKALKLDLQVPAEVRAMAAQIDKIVGRPASFTKALDLFGNGINTRFLDTYNQVLAKLPKPKKS